jgi:hypothetical protein
VGIGDVRTGGSENGGIKRSYSVLVDCRALLVRHQPRHGPLAPDPSMNKSINQSIKWEHKIPRAPIIGQKEKRYKN